MTICKCTTKNFENTLYIPLNVLMTPVMNDKKRPDLTLGEALNIDIKSVFKKQIQYERSTNKAKAYMGEYLASLGNKKRMNEFTKNSLCPIALTETELNSANEQKTINVKLADEIKILAIKHGCLV